MYWNLLNNSVENFYLCNIVSISISTGPQVNNLKHCIMVIW